MMCKQLHVFVRMAVVGASLTFVLPLAAQQQAVPTAGTPSETPTKRDPRPFTAFIVSMQTELAGVTEIVIERWTTTAERAKLLALVETAKYGEGGQRKQEPVRLTRITEEQK
jgi:hypothetical protein